MREKLPNPTERLAALTEIVSGFAERRILCVGDVMLDRFIYGGVKRISPEAPVPIINVTREHSELGGAGNVLRNLVALGARNFFVSVVGDDDAGGDVGKLLGALDKAEYYLCDGSGRETTIKTRFFSQHNHHLLRADKETVEPLSSADIADLERVITSQINTVDAVVLSDYGKGVLNGSLSSFIIAAASKAGKPTVVDPKGVDYHRYKGASVLTPNRAELEQVTGGPVNTEGAIVDAAQTLRAAAKVSAVLVTRSGDGMTLVEADGAKHMLATTREVADVTGAGDTVVATLALALACGASLSDAAYLANAAAGVVVARHGTAAVSTPDITAAVLHDGLAHAEQKIVDRATAGARAKSWREKKLKIGFTNGCFDLLHPGHVSLLRQAREACDRLIVGLNSDLSIQRLKGAGRPVQNEMARAAVMASLAPVDLVVVFGEDTPMGLISALRPDVLVKGADYARTDVVGGDFVEGYGGRVVLVDVIGPYSTTATIAAMNSAQKVKI
ncbi:MAG TPA: bifunctional heptose 7-phosphate kinase/heptose 1-phosphate adenyltransferase [Rhodospirillaceae bacterium]|nr:bifunctional heptose 7-phosphate kinase/heptose 1-phosphate adenyltransferase [Rhodospirillaceae bacterium]